MSMDALVKFEQNEALLQSTAAKFDGLKVAGLEDREGLERVRKARLVLRGFRVSIENDRKALKANALEFGRKVDAEAKRLTAMIEPTEKALALEENWVAEEKARLEREAAERRRQLGIKRAAALRKLGAAAHEGLLETMSDDEFSADLAVAQEAHDAAQEKKRAEEAARKAEAARLAEERRKLDEERAALEAERRAFEAAKPKPEPEPEAEQGGADSSGNESPQGDGAPSAAADAPPVSSAMSDAELVAEARFQWESDDVGFDDAPRVERDPKRQGGAWVAAWLWVDES